MVAAYLVLASSVLGQSGYGFYGQTPLWLYDPVRYARFYSGSGYYNYPPPVFAPPKTLVPPRSVMSLPGLTGRVIGLNERQKLITLRLPAETVNVPYGPFTRFEAIDGSFPEIGPGMLINVNQNRVTVLARGQYGTPRYDTQEDRPPPPPTPGLGTR
jgi:hypothetical protein